MKLYLEKIVNDGPRTTSKRMRIIGDGVSIAYIVFEEQNALAPHNWSERVRFQITRGESTMLGHAVGEIGYASGGDAGKEVPND